MTKLKVIAVTPLTLWDVLDPKTQVYATPEDVENQKVYTVPESKFWKDKVEREHLLAYAPEKKVKEKTDETK
jgi:hypothetical protein